MLFQFVFSEPDQAHSFSSIGKATSFFAWGEYFKNELECRPIMRLHKTAIKKIKPKVNLQDFFYARETTM